MISTYSVVRSVLLHTTLACIGLLLAVDYLLLFAQAAPVPELSVYTPSVLDLSNHTSVEANPPPVATIDREVGTTGKGKPKTTTTVTIRYEEHRESRNETILLITIPRTMEDSPIPHPPS